MDGSHGPAGDRGARHGGAGLVQPEHVSLARDNQRRLWFVLAVGLVVLATEFVGGILSNSLVLLADAAHYLADVASVALALLAVSWSLKPPTRRKSFGYRRAEVVSAFVQAMALWALSVYFLIEAAERVASPPEVSGPLVMLVGGVTLVANIGLAAVLHRGSGHSINVRAAYLHILSDVLGSLAALLAGAFVHFWGWHVADPLLTIFVTILILAFTWRLTRQSLHILLEGTPVHIDADQVRKAMLDVPGIRDVHDLHIWTHSPGSESLTAHVVLAGGPSDEAGTDAVRARLRRDFGIDHITIQPESPDRPCDTLRHHAD